jgi:hypothetical protein
VAKTIIEIDVCSGLLTSAVKKLGEMKAIPGLALPNVCILSSGKR